MFKETNAPLVGALTIGDVSILFLAFMKTLPSKKKKGRSLDVQLKNNSCVI